MFESQKSNERIEKKLAKIDSSLKEAGFYKYMSLKSNTRRFFKRCFFEGIVRGFGMAVGFTVLGAIVIVLLQKMAGSSIPFIAEFISEIISIIEKR